MLSFEKIRELERNERESKQLQKLPENFLEDLKEYLRRKEKISDKTSSDILELQNVKNTIRRIFELREHKLIEAVMFSVRTGMPVDNLTQREEAVFYQLVDNMKRFREGFYQEIEKEPAPRKEIITEIKAENKAKTDTKQESKEQEKESTKTESNVKEKDMAEKPIASKDKTEQQKEKKKIMYKVLKTIPAFIGPDLKKYELKEGDVVELPEPLDRFLTEKKLVEKT